MKVSEPICVQSAASCLPLPMRAPPGSGEWVARSEASRGAAPRGWPASAGAPTWPAQWATHVASSQTWRRRRAGGLLILQVIRPPGAKRPEPWVRPPEERTRWAGRKKAGSRRGGGGQAGQRAGRVHAPEPGRAGAGRGWGGDGGGDGGGVGAALSQAVAGAASLLPF